MTCFALADGEVREGEGQSLVHQLYSTADHSITLSVSLSTHGNLMVDCFKA